MRIRHAIKSLRRRQAFLKKRLENTTNRTDMGYDLGEIAALEIAIRSIQMAIDYGVVALTNQGEPLFYGQTDFVMDEVDGNVKKLNNRNSGVISNARTGATTKDETLPASDRPR